MFFVVMHSIVMHCPGAIDESASTVGLFSRWHGSGFFENSDLAKSLIPAFNQLLG